MTFPRESQVSQYYGKVGTNQTSIVVPEGYNMRYAWEGNPPIRRITCHEKVADSLTRILERTLDHYNTSLRNTGLDLFGGCLNVRRKRGGSGWSMHSWGIALDLDPDRNQLRWTRTQARFAGKLYEPFWRIVEEEGWVSLGRARNYDWMHSQAARL